MTFARYQGGAAAGGGAAALWYDVGMKLYVLRERWGMLVESARQPRTPTVVERDEVRAFVYDPSRMWQIPYGVGQPMYPTLKQCMEMAYYFQMLHVFTYGLEWGTAKALTTAALEHWVAHIHLVLLSGVVFYFTVFPAVLMGLVWLINPTRRSFLWDGVFPWRYIFAYNERLWWADFIGKDSDGSEYYVLCEDPGVCRMTEQRRVWHKQGFVDVWRLFGSWVQSKSAFLSYKEWRWDTFFVDYVGMLTYIGGGQWKLREPGVDDWQSEAPPGYIHPPGLRCLGWSQIP